MNRRALFLDRDGVINRDGGYVHDPRDIEFVPGIFDLCLHAQECGYLIIVATNQAGVARGYYSEDAVVRLHRWIAEKLEEKGIKITAFYYCPTHPEGLIENYRCESFYRKPNPGMLLKAHAEFCIDMAGSVLIGDKLSDIEAGRRAGVGTNLFLGTGPCSDLRITKLTEAIQFLPECGSPKRKT
jgi:D-glycero-D-manno-heptose 1,7-bisphosphate phosphatase